MVQLPLLKKLLAIVICLFLGLVFLYSGYTKLLPVIETFEMTFVDVGLAGWKIAPIIARAFIGLEFFLGLLLVVCFRLRFTLTFVIIVLVLFIIYLIAQIVSGNGDSNCGCFGEHIRMTPIEAIIKNLVMIVLALAALLLYSGWRSRFQNLFLSVSVVTALGLPFLLNPVDLNYTSNNLDEKVNYPLQLDLLYSPADTTKVERPVIDLRKGKHVVAFLSLRCRHCIIAATKFAIIKKSDPSLPVYFILNGDRKHLAYFLNETRSQDIPHSFCLGKTFVQLASARLPRIYYLHNGMVVKKVDYFELSQEDMRNWMEK